MGRISDFLIDAAWLWLGTAIVVIVASAVHYAISSSERKDFRQRVETQEAQQESEDFQT
jgi:hypothetical protein